MACAAAAGWSAISAQGAHTIIGTKLHIAKHSGKLRLSQCLCRCLHCCLSVELLNNTVRTYKLMTPPYSYCKQEIDRKNASISGQLRGFRLFLKMYVYNLRTDTFDPVPGMPDHLPHQICQASKALQQIETAGKIEGCN